MKYLTTEPRGFVALMSAVVISAALMVLMASVSTTSFYARADTARTEYKRISLGLAESCTNAALLKVVQDFNYDITKDADYGPLPHNAAKSGVEVEVGSDFCYITAFQLDSVEDAQHRKRATTTVQAEYNGAFSNITTTFSVQNPDRGMTVPPPTCNLQATPASVLSGKTVTIQWSSSANATDMSLSNGVGPVTPVLSGSYPLVVTGNGQVTFTATVSNAGGSTQCSASVTVLPPPPAPDCADVVMMLDRSGSMFDDPQWITDEKAAATGFLDQYKNYTPALNPLPKVGIGRFGDASGQNADIIAQLSNISSYAAAYNAIATGLADNGSYTNLADAIYKGDMELNSSVRHSSGKKKGLILISDGAPNRPSGNAVSAATAAASAAKIGTGPGKHADGIPTQIFSIHFGDAGSNFSDQTYLSMLSSPTGTSENNYAGNGNTGAKPATQTKLPSNWMSPGNALVADGLFATSTVSNQQQAVGNFNVSLSNGLSVTGIEFIVDGQVSGTATVPSGTLTPQSQGLHTAWTNGAATIDETGTPSCSSADSIITGTTGNRESATISLSTIPNGSVITSIDVVSYDKADVTSGGTYRTFVRVNGVDTDAPGVALSSNTTGGSSTCNSPKTQNIDITDVTKGVGTTLEIGVVKVAGNTNLVRVGALRAIVNYTTPAASCNITANLSWNGGGNWTSSKTISLPSVQGPVTVGGSSDSWGHTWTNTEMSDANLVARITNSTCTGGLQAKVDAMSVRVHYSGVDAVSENGDGDHFFIAPQSSDMVGVFNTIGVILCPAIAPSCSNTIDDDLDGKIDTQDAGCHTDSDPLNAASYSPLDNDEWIAPALPPAPPAPPPPPNIDIGSWQEKPILLNP